MVERRISLLDLFCCHELAAGMILAALARRQMAASFKKNTRGQHGF
jgi:hypothetical protein